MGLFYSKITDFLECLDAPEVQEKIRNICQMNVYSSTGLAKAESEEAENTESQNSVIVQESLQDAEEKITAVFSKAAALKSENKQGMQKDFNAQNIELQNKIKVLQEEKEELKNDIKSLREEIAKLNKNYANLQDEKDRLESKNISFQAENKELNSNLQQAKKYFAEINNQNEKLQAERDKKEQELLSYKTTYTKADEFFNIALTLKNQGFQLPFTLESPLQCALILSKSSDLENLWSTALDQHKMFKDENIKEFYRLIEISVDFCNMCYSKPVLNIISAEKGTSYIPSQQYRTQNSQPSGRISKILLPGIKNIRTGKTIKMPLVEVK